VVHTLGGHPLTDPPTEGATAARVQLDDARARLHVRAERAGIAPGVVDAAVDRVAARYATATVHAFLGILVEREARELLGL
jgi:hypothetical protein